MLGKSTALAPITPHAPIDRLIKVTPLYVNLRGIFCKRHLTCDSRVFRISSYFSQLKIKVILEYGRNFSFIKHFVESLGGRETTVVFQEMQQCPQAIF